MGMFDRITCEMELPQTANHSVGDLQTKCLQRTLDRYVIGKDGWLSRDGYTVHFNGPLYFYDFTRSGCDGWVKYCAIFKDGKCASITVDEDK